jgi:membrane associated rhomboid family serine protease
VRLPESWRTARATIAIAAATALAFLLVRAVGLDARAASWAGFMPYRFSFDGYAPGAPVWTTPFTATLVHADLIHLGFNLIFFVVCGRHVERALGASGLLALYLAGALAAAGGHYLITPQGTVPMIGASGAIAAILGAYAVLSFRPNRAKGSSAKVAFSLHALWLVVGWVVLQLVLAFVSYGTSVGIAFGAHFGGFVAGLVLARPLLLFRWRKA